MSQENIALNITTSPPAWTADAKQMGPWIHAYAFLAFPVEGLTANHPFPPNSIRSDVLVTPARLSIFSSLLQSLTHTA